MVLAELRAGMLTLGQQVAVDNRAGGGGNIGAELAARAAPDGYTIVMGSSSNFGVNPSLYRNLPFDPIRDFEPVGMVSLAPNVLVLNPGVPARTIKELVALARAKPGSLNFASSGTGGSPHLAGELFKLVTETNITHIAYKGTGESITGVAGHTLNVMMLPLNYAQGMAKEGRVRIIAVTSAKRLQEAPLDAAEGKQRQEHQCHDHGGKHDRAANFAARVEDDVEGGKPLCFRQGAIFT